MSYITSNIIICIKHIDLLNMSIKLLLLQEFIVKFYYQIIESISEIFILANITITITITIIVFILKTYENLNLICLLVISSNLIQQL